MPTPPPISLPAGYAPAVAFGFADAEARLAMVSAAKPLPVTLTASAPPAPLAGSTTQSLMAGPYHAVRDLPILVALEGNWTGTVQLLRSDDGGATRLPLRVAGIEWGTYHEQGVEQAWIETEHGISFYLDIALVSGTVAYRVSQ